MKKRIFLLLGLISLITVNARNINLTKVSDRYNKAVTFVERGIQFHVFLNGDFDFDTNYDEPYVDYYGRRTPIDSGVLIERDYQGRVSRVGNVFINYDAYGNVKRIGGVYIGYRFGQVSSVGNLRIEYDRYGYPDFIGRVKYINYYDDEDDDYYDDDDGFRISIDINIGDEYDYEDEYFYRREFRDNYRQFREDNNFYYYRAKPNANIGERNRVLKRRKSSKMNREREHDRYRGKSESRETPEERESTRKGRRSH